MNRFCILPILRSRFALPVCKLAVSLLLIGMLAGLSPQRQSATGGKIERLSSAHLPNAVRVHEQVVCGGMPEGDAAFQELQSLGIKTIISVDGARPDITAATRRGMRYVHLPHGYDGVPEQRSRELAKAVRDLPGPIYIHCHHGQHRSPAAAAVACVGAGLIEQRDALAVLKVAGTSPAYLGLFQSVETAHPLEKSLLDSLSPDFPPVAQLSAIAEAMVAMEQVLDRLLAIQKNGWRTPEHQPDLVPAHEALLLGEHFKELIRLPEFLAKPVEFRQLARQGLAASRKLEAGLIGPIDAQRASGRLFEISSNCKACHQQIRDRPIVGQGNPR